MNNEPLDQAILSSENNIGQVDFHTTLDTDFTELRSKLREIVNAIYLINKTAQLVQAEFNSIVESHPEADKELIANIMKELSAELDNKIQNQEQPNE